MVTTVTSKRQLGGRAEVPRWEKRAEGLGRVCVGRSSLLAWRAVAAIVGQPCLLLWDGCHGMAWGRCEWDTSLPVLV